MDDLKPLNYSSKDNTININQSHNDISLGGDNDLQDFEMKTLIQLKPNLGETSEEQSCLEVL